MRRNRASRSRRRTLWGWHEPLAGAAKALALILLLPLAAARAEDVNTLNPAYPIVDDRFQVTAEWSIALDQPYNRAEQGSELVLFRPGFTIWVSAWPNENGDSIDQRARWIAAETSRGAYDVVTGSRGPLFRHAFRLDEVKAEGVLQGYFGYTVAAGGHLQMAIFFDNQEDLATAKSIVESVGYSEP